MKRAAGFRINCYSLLSFCVRLDAVSVVICGAHVGFLVV